MTTIIESYIQAYNPVKYLFKGSNGGKYTQSSSRQILKRTCLKAGIYTRVTLHTLRHSYATHLLEAGVGLRYIQEILGHQSPKTTMWYTHVSGKNIKDVRSPLDDMDI